MHRHMSPESSVTELAGRQDCRPWRWIGVGRVLCAFALLAIASAGTAGCSDSDAERVCGRIYEDCRGALVDPQGSSTVRESCVRLLESLSGEQPGWLGELAVCVAKTPCAQLVGCFGS